MKWKISSPFSSLLKDMCSQSVIQQPHAPFGSKWEMEEYICRHILLTEKILGFQAPPIFFAFPPLFILRLLSSEPGVSQSLRKERTEREKKKENPGLIKCLAVCVPSQFISLCLESIADVWERDCWGRSQLLQKWDTLFRKSMKS